MNRFATLFLAGAACALAGSAPASAGVPSAANSTVPACLVTCPMGDLHSVVIVRDLANNPLSGASVVFDFSACTGAFFCPPLPNDPYITDPTARTVRMFTDATGKADFPLRIGGTCGTASVRLFANGVLLSNHALASPDQNGNGVATGIIDVDPALFAAKLGTVDPTADFDCSGGPVNAADQDIFNHHLSHSCNGFVDTVERRTWGSVKQHYR